MRQLSMGWMKWWSNKAFLIKQLLLVLVVFVLIHPVSGYADEAELTLEQFLKQVKDQHSGYLAAMESQQAGVLRARESSLILSPTFFTTYQFGSDAKLNQPLLMGYSSINSNVLSFGFAQNTSFGLQAKLHYDLVTAQYVNPQLLFSMPGVSFINATLASAAPVLEITQSLWSNGFGRSTRAAQDQMEAQALVSSYTAEFQKKAQILQAESAYWRLVLARQANRLQKEAVSRAEKIHEWSLRRTQLHLGDRADSLQAEASLRSRQLELFNIENEVRAASSNFNQARGVASDQVSEPLSDLSMLPAGQLEPPQQIGLRADLKAAEQGARAARAGAKLASEKNLPTLDLVGSLALNGQPTTNSVPTTLSDAMSYSFTFNRPTYLVALRFSLPLNFGATSKARDGWRREQIAADLNYERKKFEQEREWIDLNQKLLEAKQRLGLSQALEALQKTKLENEQDRLQRGRTTTFQVLMFEQEFLLSQLTRIREQANILSLVAQMRLFEEDAENSSSDKPQKFSEKEEGSV